MSGPRAGIGIDGGQTGIRLRLCVDGQEAFEPLLLEGQRRNSGLGFREIAEAVEEIATCSDEPIGRVVAGLSALPAEATEIEQLAGALRAASGGAQVWIGDDTATSHAGAFGGDAGVVLAVGTGAVAFAFDAATGRSRLIDGAGYLIGDVGGGFWIGRRAVRAVLRAHEGRGPSTSLESRIFDLLGPAKQLPTRIHQDPQAVSAIAGLAHVVITEATAGDPIAISILEAAADELLSTIEAAAAAVATADRVAFTGRLLGDRSVLSNQLIRRLGESLPRLQIASASGTSLDGACRLALVDFSSPYRSLFAAFDADGSLR